MRKLVPTAAAICILALCSLSISSVASADASGSAPQAWISDNKFFVKVEDVPAGTYYLDIWWHTGSLNHQMIGKEVHHLGGTATYNWGGLDLPTDILNIPAGKVVRFEFASNHNAYEGSFIKGPCPVSGCNKKDCNVHACDDTECYGCPHTSGTPEPFEYLIYAAVAVAVVMAVALVTMRMRAQRR